jgi:hypothetical protein
LAVAALGVAPPAAGFCRTSACELGEEERVNEGGKACTRDAHECVTEGNRLHWGSPCLTYAVQRDGSPAAGISAEEFQALVEQAFLAWEQVSCPGGGSPRFHAQYQGLVSCHRREAVCGTADKNVNVMMLHDSEWPDAPSTIGLTRPSGGTVSGLVLDTDLEINSQDYDFSLGATGPSALDLSQVLAHEVGHFLGLSHSDFLGALMSKDYASLQLSRELITSDDIAAICEAYPPGPALSCPAPPPPAYDTCQVTPGQQQDCVLPSMTHDHKSSGCSMGPSHSSGLASAGSASLLAVLLGLARRRRQRTTRR